MIPSPIKQLARMMALAVLIGAMTQTVAVQSLAASPTATATVTSTPAWPPNARRVPADYATIQEAIDAANHGDIVVIAPGTYTGSGNMDITFRGKELLVRSESGADTCIIDCQNSGRGFVFNSGETSVSVLAQLTVSNGSVTGNGGGILCTSASPQILDCIITGCDATGAGGGIACESGSPAAISGCVIDMCAAGTNGGGLYLSSSSSAVTNCQVTSNVSSSNGGGAYAAGSSPSFRNCLFAWNVSSLGSGGGLSLSGTIQLHHCTITGNSAQNYGRGIYLSSGALIASNSIVYYNGSSAGQELYINSGSISATYCDIRGGYTGVGNIDFDPAFTAGPGGPFYLSQIAAGQADDSRCVNAGSGLASGLCFAVPSGTMCLSSVTTRSDSAADTGTVDMGYHYLPSGYVTATPTITPTAATPTRTPTPTGATRTPTWTGTTTPTPTFTATPLSQVRRVPSQYGTIQAAINASRDSDIVLVADGVYSGAWNTNLDFLGKAITVQSEGGPQACVIDCRGTSRAALFDNGEGNGTVFSGFEILDGSAVGDGGGIVCSGSSPRITDCWFTSCDASGSGGAIYGSSTSLILSGCVITQCSAVNGGGIYIASGGPVIANTMIQNNLSSNNGGGCYLPGSTTSFRNCLIAGNISSGYYGGGLYISGATQLANCTIAGNASSSSGRGIYQASGSVAITNSIIYFNGTSASQEFYVSGGSASVSFTNIRGDYSGAGNIDVNPVFTDGPAGSFYLSQLAAGQAEDSRCIDAGSNLAASICYSMPGGPVCLSELTTRTDGAGDSGFADLGYHYLPASYATMTPTSTPLGATHTPLPTVTFTPTQLPAVRLVPSQYATIQLAINACRDQDMVLVADGVYDGPWNTNLDYLGKAIIVRSEGGAGACVIDCGGIGRGVQFNSGEGNSSVLQGFTIANGLVSGNGGGILCSGSAPQILDCLIVDCAAGGNGGGVSLENSSSPVISGCSITQCYGASGGAIYCSGGAPSFVNSQIGYNIAASYGGGFYLSGANAQFRNCLITGNISDSYYGGGMYVSGTGNMLNCTVSGNSSTSSGKGIYQASGTLTIVNSIIYFNGTSASHEYYLSGGTVNMTFTDIRGDYSGTGNIDVLPAFADGPGGYYYLSHIAAGQAEDSRCINAGSADASAVCFSAPSGSLCLSELTSRSDGVTDSGLADLGFHYLPASYATATPTATPTAPTPTRTPTPVGPTATPTRTPTFTATPDPVVRRVPSQYETIQLAINSCRDGDTVLVEDGTFTGPWNTNLDFLGKQIAVRSENGPAACVINCQGVGRGVLFNTGEGSGSILQGFTIANGTVSGSGGGIWCYGASPQIIECRITNCAAAAYGGGIYCENSASPTISGCVITQCTASSGGGLFLSGGSAAVVNSEIRYNTSASYGAGVYVSGATPAFRNCLIAGNISDSYYGGGLYLSGTVTMLNCTVAGNSSTSSGKGIYQASGALNLTNGIIYFNGSSASHEYYLSGGTVNMTYTNIRGDYAGIGNIDVTPAFTEGAGGSFYLSHLAAGQAEDSRCINAGGSLAADVCFAVPSGTVCMSELSTRTDGAGDSGLVDQGYHYVPSSYATATPTATPTAPTPTRTPTPVGPTYTPTRTPTGTATPLPRVLRVPSEYETIQLAINTSRDGDTVLVADGTFTGTWNMNLDFLGKAITVRSENGPDYTTIDCDGAGRGVNFNSGEGNASILEGFTIANGSVSGTGGGILCVGSSPQIISCRITDCAAVGAGGGLSCESSSSPVLFSCAIVQCFGSNGGGAYISGGAPVFTSTRFEDNTSSSYGGGVYISGATAAFRNCLIGTNTSTSYYAGGMYVSGTVQLNNCTVAGNMSSSSGRGIYLGSGALTIINSILYYNSASAGYDLYVSGGTANMSYSDIRGDYSGTGNFDLPPAFAAGPEGWYYLSHAAAGQTDDSRCANAGSGLAADICFPIPSGTVCLSELSTRADGVADSGLADLGFHYAPDTYATATPSATPTAPTPTRTPTPVGPTATPTRTPTATATPLPVVRLVPTEYETIQLAINTSRSGDTVLVADGTYTGAWNSDLDFLGKSLTVRSENGPSECVIDCQGARRGGLFNSGESRAAVFDGFTITRGSVNGNGGGIACTNGSSPAITNCVLNQCAAVGGNGGGLYLASSASPIIANCLLTQNSAVNGGGVYAESASVVLSNCEIRENTATSNGGGIYQSSGSGLFGNCLIVNNSLQGTSAYGGGGRWSSVNPLRFNSCTFNGNTGAASGGGMYVSYCTTTLLNSILYGNSAGEIYQSGGTITATYCDIYQSSGVYPGTGNINANPLFVAVAGQTHYLSHVAAGQEPDSPCLNIGSDDAAAICVTVPSGSICLDMFTTRTDQVTDSGVVDLGYHHPILDLPTLTPTPTVTAAPTDTPTPLPSATMTATPTRTPTAMPSATPTHTETPLPTATPTPSPTDTPAVTPTPAPIPATGPAALFALALGLTALLLRRSRRSN